MVHLNREELAPGDATLLAGYVAAATRYIEKYTNRRLVTQDVRVRLDGFGCGINGPVFLPIGPVQSVLSIVYRDAAGVEHTLEPESYRLVLSRLPNEVVPVFGSTWPVPVAEPDSVAIALRVGYGDSPADVPDDITQALRLLVAQSDMQREAGSQAGEIIAAPWGVEALLSGHKLWL